MIYLIPFNPEEESESVPKALARRTLGSVSVNTARYIGLEPGVLLDIQPACRNLNQSFGFENNSRLCGIVLGSKPNRLLWQLLIMTLQCALKEKILINYFFRFNLFVINNIEIICKDLD